MEKIKKSAPREENLYLSRSGVFVNLNESVINIQTSNFNQGTPKKFEAPTQKPLLEQSAFYIDL